MADCDSNLPYIFVIGLQGKKSTYLIDGIIGSHVSDSAVPSDTKWLIDNKYYTATVCFNDVKDINDLSPTVLHRGEAMLIYIDPSKDAVLEELDLILHTVHANCELEKQILVVDNFENLEDEHFNGLTKLEALNWCIKHGFELEELCSDDFDDLQEDENDKNSLEVPFLGLRRITQALHAHCWSNLRLKDKTDRDTTRLHSKNLCVIDDDNGITECLEVESSKDSSEVDLDNFSVLLSSLNDMKITANSLPAEERKAYAEKMAINFWQSIGGDDEEIEGICSDSE